MELDRHGLGLTVDAHVMARSRELGGAHPLKKARARAHARTHTHTHTHFYTFAASKVTFIVQTAPLLGGGASTKRPQAGPSPRGRAILQLHKTTAKSRHVHASISSGSVKLRSYCC